MGADFMKTKTVILTLLVLVALAIIPVQSQYITITNSGGMTERDINVYYPNVTTGQMSLLGRFNTTSVLDLNGSVDYTFDLVPQQANPLDDPGTWLESVLAWATTNATALVFMIFLALLWLGRK